MPDQQQSPHTRQSPESEAALAQARGLENAFLGQKLATSVFKGLRSTFYDVFRFVVILIGLSLFTVLVRHWLPEAVVASGVIVGIVSLFCIFKPIPFGWLEYRSATSAGLICAFAMLAPDKTSQTVYENSQIADQATNVREPVSEPAPEPTGASDAAREVVWIEMSKDAIRSRLRDPSSAKFRNVTFHMMNGDTPVVCGQVNSRNGLGGMSGYQGFIASGDTLAFLESDFASGEFLAARNEMCRG